jgi:putative ABC transport system permease protein
MQGISLLSLIGKRIASNIGLVIFSFLGLMMAVTLLCSIPLYADSATQQGLEQALAVRPEYSPRPRSTILVQLLRRDGADLGIYDTYQRADRFVMGNANAIVGVPLRGFVRYAETPAIRLLARTGPTADDLEMVKFTTLAFASDLKEHIVVLEGRFPSPKPTPDGEIEVLVGARVAQEFAVGVGERLVILEGVRGGTPLEARVAGIWEAADQDERYWFEQPSVLDFNLFIPEEAFHRVVRGSLAHPIGRAIWYMSFSPRDVDPKSADALVHNLKGLSARLAGMDPGLEVRESPLRVLVEHRRGAFLLKINLYIFSIPAIAIILYYIVLSSSHSVDRERTEIAMLKSRGSSNWQILGIYLLEGLAVGSLAMILGPLLGVFFAQLVGRARTFLHFSGSGSLPAGLSPDIYRYAVAAVGLSLAASLLPALGVARHSIVSFQREAVRSQRRPFWQRYFLDFVLLLVSLYGHYTLRQSGSILGTSVGDDPFNNPLLLVLPALFIFSVALVLIRFFPIATEFLANLVRDYLGLSVMLGLRYVARVPGYHASLVLLLILTLALGTFNGSTAQTLDRNYVDQVRYRMGGELKLLEMGSYNQASERWEIPPMSVHEDVPGLEGWVQVDRFNGAASVGQKVLSKKVDLLGVDHSELSRVAWFRDDFAEGSLADLTNVLAQWYDTALVSRSFLEENALELGDRVILKVENVDIDFTLGGVVDYFPTLYPNERHFFIGNLDYIYLFIDEGPFEVWVSTSGELDVGMAKEILAEQGLFLSEAIHSGALIEERRDDPMRIGALGLLSMGFMISALVTSLGFLGHSFVSLRKRSVQLGILRAMGLTSRQLVLLVVFEEVFLIVTGVAIGTLLGLLTGNLFIPFLQIGESTRTLVPPFMLVTPWGDILRLYLVLGLALVATAAGTIWLLFRIRIHQAVKLGEMQI